jgi:hypothetical protein
VFLLAPILILIVLMMTTIPEQQIKTNITRTGAAGYSVVTVPYFNVRKGSVEIYNDLVSALQRHASICSQLRADGWSIASYTTT